MSNLSENRVTLVTHKDGDLIFIGGVDFAGDSRQTEARVMLCELAAAGFITLDIIECCRAAPHPDHYFNKSVDLETCLNFWEERQCRIMLDGVADDRKGLDFTLMQIAATGRHERGPGLLEAAGAGRDESK